ncbi:AI-2E family transporter [Chrysiogenes arsenatis]|uniref:AI-2E family transporter n=1 Tax=Chrysiogenes arsenatis TaxID=309797 RepID=UPI0003FCE06A|nr:AI-2E family transporter [Chrysiogenes arsenatis]
MLKVVRSWYEDHFSNPQVAILTISLVIGFSIVIFLGNLLMPFFAALVLAYLLDGIITFLQRFKVPRNFGVVTVFIFFMGFIGLFVFTVVPVATRQLTQLARELPTMVLSLQSVLLSLPEKYPEFISPQQVRSLIETTIAEFGNISQHIVSLSLASVTGAIAFLVYLVLVPLMIFFMLKDKNNLIVWFTRFLPYERSLLNGVWEDVNSKIASYIRGKATEIFIVWVVTFVTFKFLGLNFTMLLSLLVGFSVLVPYVGATVVTFPIAFIAYFQWGIGDQFFYIMIAYAIIQFLDGNILVPLLFSEMVNIHPIAIIVAILVFGGVWGFWGIFFSIPLATLVQAIIRAWPDRKVLLRESSHIIHN